MRVPFWLLRLLPMWSYICPACRKEVEKNSCECPHCGEKYGSPVRVPPKVLKDAKALEDYVHKHVFPRVSRAQRDYLAQYFTEIFSNGFEEGDFSAWTSTTQTGTTLEVQSGTVHCGDYAMHAVGGTGGVSCFAEKSLSLGSDNHMRFYLYRVANAPVRYGGFRRSTWAVSCEVTVSGGYWRVMFMAGGGANTVTSTTVAAKTGEWQCVELYYKVHASEGEVRVFVDGAEVEDLTQTGLNTTGETPDKIRVGLEADYATSEAYFDCVIVADAYIGPEEEGATYTRTWQTDVLFKKLGVTKSLGADTAFQKRDIQLTADADVLFKRLDVAKTADIDTLFQKLNVTKTADIDVLLKALGIEKTAQVDALFKKLDLLETFGVDVALLKRDVIRSFGVDARFGAALTQELSRQIDTLFKKLNATKTFGLDAHFGQLEAETYAKNFALDIIFAYKVRLPELWLDENGKLVLNVSKPYTWVGT